MTPNLTAIRLGLPAFTDAPAGGVGGRRAGALARGSRGPETIERPRHVQSALAGEWMGRRGEPPRQRPIGPSLQREASAVALKADDRRLREPPEPDRGRRGSRGVGHIRGTNGVLPGFDGVRRVQRDPDSGIAVHRADLEQMERVAPLADDRSGELSRVGGGPPRRKPRSGRRGVRRSAGKSQHRQERQATSEALHRGAWTTMSKRTLPPESGVSGWLRSNRSAPPKKETPTPAPAS